ncbi:TetR family transcriptional regulator [Actinoplanes derwentensis]|uniref:Transcriptional regulator, TetR family n=1 Tax=Actinoplanes derwentensis TaxID=113562 RepID=A0A1H2A2D4_9ACTN|nr:TetR family transcriptional regulator [Actinoplanes derwentensis]GID83417.1 TetR family transcriptional regulator [Actinoplanes derwentensis]SDT40033.1 transcriptional regulator, TetR family [Actinoplanes derwentensis]
MGRVSQAQAAQNRDRIVAIAARLFRERGIGAVSVADVMAEAGLTHGGFYRHFASKDALVAEAVTLAFTRSAGVILDDYLSAAHRDDPGGGCPTAGFGGDVAKELGGDATRAAYAQGVEGFARALGTGGDPDLVALSTMVGALILSRATAGTDLSDRILAAARTALEPAPLEPAVSPVAGSAAGPAGAA